MSNPLEDVTFVTPNTFAYIYGQLDYPEWRRQRVHILSDELGQDDMTLCGCLAHGWEAGGLDYYLVPEADRIVKLDDVPWLCQTCKRAYTAQHKPELKGNR